MLILCPCVHNPNWIICCLFCNWNMKKTKNVMSMPEYIPGELGCGLGYFLFSQAPACCYTFIMAIYVIIRKLSFIQLTCSVECKVFKFSWIIHLSLGIIPCFLQCVLPSFKIQSHALHLLFSPQNFTSLMEQGNSP